MSNKSANGISKKSKRDVTLPPPAFEEASALPADAFKTPKVEAIPQEVAPPITSVPAPQVIDVTSVEPIQVDAADAETINKANNAINGRVFELGLLREQFLATERQAGGALQDARVELENVIKTISAKYGVALDGAQKWSFDLTTGTFRRVE